MQTLQGTIGFELVGVGRAHRNRAAEALAEIGLHPGQEMILLQLREQGGSTQGELAARCGVEAPTISKALARMAGNGLVERHDDELDARAARIHLTAKGRALCTDVLKIWSNLERRSLAGISAEEREILRGLLARVKGNLT